MPLYVSAIERRKALRERVQRHTDHLDALEQTPKKLGVGEPAIKQLQRGLARAGTRAGANYSLTNEIAGKANVGSWSSVMPRIVKTKIELESLVVTTLRSREQSSCVASVTIVPMPGPAGAWKVQTFEEGSSSRGGCLLSLYGLIPVLQTRFELGV